MMMKYVYNPNFCIVATMVFEQLFNPDDGILFPHLSRSFPGTSLIIQHK